MTMHKNGKNICKALIGLALTAALLSGCGKSEKVTGGEDIGYPYSYEVKSNGTVLLTLDGSTSPDARWTVAGWDETILDIKEKKAEKDGKITYTITPVGEGSADLAFNRESTVEGGATPSSATDGGRVNAKYWTVDENLEGDTSKHEETTGVKKTDTAVNDEDNAGADDAANLPTPDEDYKSVAERKLESSNVLCTISMNITATPNGKNKFTTGVYAVAGTVTEGVLSGDDDAVMDYEVWCDESGTLQVRLPYVNFGWEHAFTCNYDAPEETEEVPGIVNDEPEADEEGNLNTIEIYQSGYLGGDCCYIINGIANGDATVVFTDLGGAYRLTLVLSVNDGRITLESNKMERVE